MDRRKCLSSLTGLTLGSATALRHSLTPAISSAGDSIAGESAETFTVGVIGHTGRGNYGHGLDTVWKRVPGTRIVAVADADANGLRNKLTALKLPEASGSTSYREMLRRHRPDLVAVCPRHVDQHCEMILAAIESGAKGIYVEKPFVRTPHEADLVLSACEKRGTKVAVAHRNRYHPVIAMIKEMIDSQQLGRLLEFRGRGKGDRRGGGEDLWVLGSHVLNLFTFLGGEPLSCSGVLMKQGRRAKQADVFKGAEGLGLLAGDELHARFQLSGGVIATFDSVANDGTGGMGFGLEVIGSKATVMIQADRQPVAWLKRGNPFDPASQSEPHLKITTAGIGKEEGDPDQIWAVQHHDSAARDLVMAVKEDRPPMCDARQGAWTVEMICGVFESHCRNGAVVPFPLQLRRHPLEAWAAG